MSLYSKSDLLAFQLNALAFAATWAEKDPLYSSLPITNIALGAITCATAYQIMKSQNSWLNKLYCFSSYTVFPYLVPQRYKSILQISANVLSLILIAKDSLPKIKRSFNSVIQEPLKATLASTIHLCNLVFPIYTLGTKIYKIDNAEKLSLNQEDASRKQKVSKIQETVDTFDYDAHQCDKILKIVSNSNIHSTMKKQCFTNHLLHLNNIKQALFELTDLVKKSDRYIVWEDANKFFSYLDSEFKALKYKEIEKIDELMSDMDKLFHEVRFFSSDPSKTLQLIDSLKIKTQNLSEYLTSLIK